METSTIEYAIDNALFQWEDGERRVRELADLEPAAFAVLEELRRRLGSTFTLDELTGLYVEGTDWATDVAARSGVWTDASAVVDAAFGRYAREAPAATAGGGEPGGSVVLAVGRGGGARLVGPADDDLVGLDDHGDRPVPGPVLGVDGVVLHGGVEPQSVALLAVVEGSLERLAGRAGDAGAGATAAAATTAATSPRALVAVLVLARSRLVLRLVGGQGRFGLVLRLGFRVEGRGDERVVLGAQVDLDLLAGARPVGGGLLGRDQLVLALEGGDVAGRDLELMSDPGVGTALADPAADLVELGLQ
jgi:hypothetical protein